MNTDNNEKYPSFIYGTAWKKDVVGTDMHALKDGSISITPLRYDLTDNAFFKEVETWERDLDVHTE